jgi:hypothetical protein
MARLGFQSGWIHFFVKKERRTGENRENKEMPFYFPFSVFSVSPVPFCMGQTQEILGGFVPGTQAYWLKSVIPC